MILYSSRPWSPSLVIYYSILYVFLLYLNHHHHPHSVYAQSSSSSPVALSGEGVWRGRTIAGGDELGYSDGDPFNAKWGSRNGQLAEDSLTGDIYFCDVTNRRVRRISAIDKGRVSTIVGRELSYTETQGPYNAVNGIGINVALYKPIGVAVDGVRRILYISDGLVKRVARIDLDTAELTWLVDASMEAPMHITLDRNGDHLYVATVSRALEIAQPSECGNAGMTSCTSRILATVPAPAADSSLLGIAWTDKFVPGVPIVVVSGNIDFQTGNTGNLNYRLFMINLNTGVSSLFIPLPTVIINEGWLWQTGIAFDDYGVLYIADVSSKQIRTFAPDGTDTYLFASTTNHRIIIDPYQNTPVDDWDGMVTYTDAFLARETVLLAPVFSVAVTSKGDLLLFGQTMLTLLYRTPPPTEFDISVSDVDDGQANVTWPGLDYMEAAGVDTLFVSWSIVGGNTRLRADYSIVVPASQTYVLISYTFEHGSTISVTVVAHNIFGESLSRLAYNASRPDVTPPPQLMWPATNIDTTSLKLSWKPSLVTYVGQRAQADSFDIIVSLPGLQIVVVQSLNLPGTARDAILSGLSPMMSYLVCISGVVGDKRGTCSEAQVISTTGLLGLLGTLPSPAGASVDYKTNIFIDNDGQGTLYVSNTNSFKIQKVTALGVVSDVAGSGANALQDGFGTVASLLRPGPIVYVAGSTPSTSNLYFIDQFCVRSVSLFNAQVSTLAGDCNNAGYRDGHALDARFGISVGNLAYDDVGLLYIADGNQVRILDIKSGEVSTAIGSYVAVSHVTFTKSRLYILDEYVFKVLDIAKQEVTIMGSLDVPNYRDGLLLPSSSSALPPPSTPPSTSLPSRVTSLSSCSLMQRDYIMMTDAGRSVVRMLDVSHNMLSTVAGNQSAALSSPRLANYPGRASEFVFKIPSDSSFVLSSTHDCLGYIGIGASLMVLYGAPPPTPISLKGQYHPSNETVVLQWAPGSPAASVQLFTVNIDDGMGGPLRPVYSGPEVSILLRNFVAGLIYKFSVTARNEFGVGVVSEIVPVFTKPPGAPSQVVIDTLGLRRANISWTIPEEYMTPTGTLVSSTFIRLGCKPSSSSSSSSSSVLACVPSNRIPQFNQVDVCTSGGDGGGGAGADGTSNTPFIVDHLMMACHMQQQGYIWYVAEVSGNFTDASIGGLYPMMVYSVQVAANTPGGSSGWSLPAYFVVAGLSASVITGGSSGGGVDGSGKIVPVTWLDSSIMAIAIPPSSSSSSSSSTFPKMRRVNIALGTLFDDEDGIVGQNEVVVSSSPPQQDASLPNSNSKMMMGRASYGGGGTISARGMTKVPGTNIIYFTDTTNNCIRILDERISLDVTTSEVFAGVCGSSDPSQDGVGTNARFSSPSPIIAHPAVVGGPYLLYVIDDDATPPSLRSISLDDQVGGSPQVTTIALLPSPDSPVGDSPVVRLHHSFTWDNNGGGGWIIAEATQNIVYRLSPSECASSVCSPSDVVIITQNVSTYSPAEGNRIFSVITDHSSQVILSDGSSDLIVIDLITSVVNIVPTSSSSGISTILWHDSREYLVLLSPDLQIRVLYTTAPPDLDMSILSVNSTHARISWKTSLPIAAIDSFQLYADATAVPYFTKRSNNTVLVYSGSSETSAVVGPLLATIPIWKLQLRATNAYGMIATSLDVTHEKAIIDGGDGGNFGSDSGSDSILTGSLSTGEIVGIAVGGGLFIALVISSFLFVSYRRRRQRREKDAAAVASSLHNNNNNNNNALTTSLPYPNSRGFTPNNIPYDLASSTSSLVPSSSTTSSSSLIHSSSISSSSYSTTGVRPISVYLKGVRRGKIVGSGSFGKVYRGEWQGVPVAMKTVGAAERKEDLQDEAAILMSLTHPNIVQFLGLYQDEKDDILYIVTEFIPDGSLDTLLRKNSPATISRSQLFEMARDVAAAMLQLETKGTVHRDLACRNLLVTSLHNRYIVKVSDFGLSKVTALQENGDILGSTDKASPLPLKWSAPESIFDGKYDNKTDVWSFGITLWEILNFGREPYSGMSNKEAVKWVAEGNRLQLPSDLPTPVAEMMKLCWHNNPVMRPSFTDIISVLTEFTACPSVASTPRLTPLSPYTHSLSRDDEEDVIGDGGGGGGGGGSGKMEGTYYGAQDYPPPIQMLDTHYD